MTINNREGLTKIADTIVDHLEALAGGSRMAHGQRGEAVAMVEDILITALHEQGYVRVEPIIAAVRADADPWQPIESAPKDGTSVLLWCVDFDGSSNGRVAAGTWHETYGGSWWDHGMEYTFSHPTHWMPLPSPPRADALREKKE